jgi:hypothetical protein
MTEVAERRSPDHPSTPPGDDALTMGIAATMGRYANDPAKLRGLLNGMALDGTLRRCGLPSGLAPMMRLPAPEGERSVRARMAELMLRRFAADGNVTHDDLLRGGFSEAEITRHKREAARIAGLDRMQS